ncbi:MAG: phosphatidylglycerophosphatase A [Alphaproteobacteria bacterium]
MPPALPPGVSFSRPSTLLATWFGVGLVPWAPGTWASLTALPIAWYLQSRFGPLAVAGAGVACFLVGWWAAAAVVRESAIADPSFVVIDEVAGQLLALALAPANPVYYAVGFIGFRLFDILKPWPVSWADASVKGGLGVMLDDALAALYVAVIVVALMRVYVV